MGHYGALSINSQIGRRYEYPSLHDELETLRSPLLFQGDTLDAHGSHPPLSWTLIWRNTYSNCYGAYMPLQLRSWGHIMWDATRIESTGAKELLMKQFREWADDWSYKEDPRERWS
jgi:hypothetical protein